MEAIHRCKFNFFGHIHFNGTISGALQPLNFPRISGGAGQATVGGSGKSAWVRQKWTGQKQMGWSSKNERCQFSKGSHQF